MRATLLSTPHLALIITATISGTIARIATLREDFRQYPTFPNGYLSFAVLGFIASVLGAVFVPAVMSGQFTAVTFLVLAIRQFQGVRQLEQKSLSLLEEVEYTKRGNGYIDGIAKTFEIRNYVSLFVALTVGVIMESLEHQHFVTRIVSGVIGALIVFLLLTRMSKGQVIADIAEVSPAQIKIEQDELFADDIFVSNRVGIERGQKMLVEEGLAVVGRPKQQHYRITLDNFGQRQAILFEMTRSLGVKRYHYTRKNYEDGRIAFVIVPILRDMDRLVEVVGHTPVLETTKKTHSMLQRWGNHRE
jgi:uncharacterized protein